MIKNFQANQIQDSDSELSNLDYEYDSHTKYSYAYCLNNNFTTPTINLLISRKSVTVEELAVPLAKKFVDIQLQDSDLIALRK